MKQGYTIIQLLVGILITTFLLSGLFQVINGFGKAQLLNTTLPGVQFDAEQMAKYLAADLRKASLCTASDSGCTVDAVISGASATGVTVYVRSGGTLQQRTYAISNGNFQKTISGVTTVLATNASLNLTYYTASAYRTSSWSSMGTPPTDTEAKTIIAVEIAATITRNNTAVTYKTIVRLRNSPKKVTPYD